jgi:hypothetical protein
VKKAFMATKTRQHFQTGEISTCSLRRPQFSEDPAKVRQWQAFLNKNHITAGSLADTVSLLDRLLWPPTEVAASQSAAMATWMPEVKQWA